VAARARTSKSGIRQTSTRDDIRRVHYEAAEVCTDAADGPDARLSLLADFFRQGEEALGDHLKSFERDEPTGVLDTWLQYVPTAGVDDALAALHVARYQGPEATVTRCLELQEEIVRLLRQLAEDLAAPTVREALRELADSEEAAVRELGLADVMQQDA
jgi:hypothetical protein